MYTYFFVHQQIRLFDIVNKTNPAAWQ